MSIYSDSIVLIGAVFHSQFVISSSSRSFVTTSTRFINITISNLSPLILLCFKQVFEIHGGFLVCAGSQRIV